MNLLGVLFPEAPRGEVEEKMVKHKFPLVTSSHLFRNVTWQIIVKSSNGCLSHAK